MLAEDCVRSLALKLPKLSQPVATYQPAVLLGNVLYVSGHVSLRVDGTLIQGQVGTELSMEQGKEAAYRIGLGVLSTVRETLGSLNRVVRMIKTVGMINAVPGFTQQPEVINGFSDLMVEVFGEAGKGARSAVGVGSLPRNVAVEIEAIFEVQN